ncbi:MAG: hypothetical protein B5766_07085 [Candidatus Lumbricidophila eiseniae]|uniref:Transcriptional regulator n=1 Tax=Candidatus Lumbricidiphila eiseniae TaxID=1969409 RepID=A0A2A6FR99_9MICO|nr:MAG: hypothetical protein B5766_07085 [Candidatus Lumbricidophila eiseniae]
MTRDSSPQRPRTARGSNLDEVRRRNLSQVLRLVHSNSGTSRAELTRATGLNRSTIADLIAELKRRGLVTESAPPQEHTPTHTESVHDPLRPRSPGGTDLLPSVYSGSALRPRSPGGTPTAHIESVPAHSASVGRPSFLISPSRSAITIAIIPEIDAVTLGLVSLGGTVLRQVRRENPRVPTVHEVVEIVVDLLAELAVDLEHAHIVGVGAALPGLVRTHDGLVNLAPHLGWRDEAFAQHLSDAMGARTRSANDASCGAIAERAFGAGRGVDDLVYLNGGASGIGGGVIAGGRLLRGANGFAGELGHTLVLSAGSPCHCGATGCLETEVTRAALLQAVGLRSDDIAQLDTALVARYATDAAVRTVVDRQLDFLTLALRNIVNTFNPQLILLGGFLATLFDTAGDRMIEGLQRSALPGPCADVRIARACLGRDNTLLIGAAELVFAEVLADPTTFGSNQPS